MNKIKNRPYYTGHIPEGDPRNPLGICLMGMNIKRTYGDIYVSQGCVIMNNEDVEKLLYDKVQVGITYSYKSFADLTSVYGYKFKGDYMKNK